MGDSTTEARRPLSPHLQIYRPMLTMMMSIAHRISGASLAAGFVLLAWWLIAVSSGPEAFATVNSFFASIIGRFVLFRLAPAGLRGREPGARRSLNVAM